MFKKRNDQMKLAEKNVSARCQKAGTFTGDGGLPFFNLGGLATASAGPRATSLLEVLSSETVLLSLYFFKCHSHLQGIRLVLICVDSKAVARWRAQS